MVKGDKSRRWTDRSIARERGEGEGGERGEGDEGDKKREMRERGERER